MKYPILKVEMNCLKLVGVAVMVVVLCGATLQAADIRLKAQGAPTSSVVRLGDVAEVTAESTQEARRLAALLLMPAPSRGQKRYLRMREVQDLLATHGEAMEKLRFKGERVIEVAAPSETSEPAERSAQNGEFNASDSIFRNLRREAWLGVSDSAGRREMSDAQRAELIGELRQMILDYVIEQSGESGEWRVEPNVANQYLELLPTATGAVACDGGEAPWTGRQRFQVSVPTAKGRAKFAITADITRPKSVLVAARPIRNGEIITASHVELQSRDDLPSRGSRILLESLEDVVGKEAALSIRAGQVLYRDNVRLPILVKRGEMVTVCARGGGIQVRTAAKARENGARGELIQVESLETRERYDAMVAGPREVVVFAGGGTSTASTAEPRRQTFRR